MRISDWSSDVCSSDLPFCDGDFYGRSTKRFGGLLRHSAQAAALVQNTLVLEITQRVLGPWCDRISLNLTQAIEIHPGARAQYPQRDPHIEHGPKGAVEYRFNLQLPLTSFTPENGVTRLCPSNSPGTE